MRTEPWRPGTPSWVDLLVDDAEAARAFYGGLFGWTFEVGGAETGFYSMAYVAEAPVAGIGQKQPGQEVPSAWTTYLATEDVDGALERVIGAGGQVLMPAMEILGQGRMAVVSDPGGAVFGLWQAIAHNGAGLVNVPGTFVWSDAMSGDYEAAKRFYPAVFGYELHEVGDGDTFSSSTIAIDGVVVGGIGELASGAPERVPPHWMVYFACADTDETIAKATGLGATVVREPWDSEFGRIAGLVGPQGETFSLIGLQDVVGQEPYKHGRDLADG